MLFMIVWAYVTAAFVCVGVRVLALPNRDESRMAGSGGVWSCFVRQLGVMSVFQCERAVFAIRFATARMMGCVVSVVQ